MTAYPAAISFSALEHSAVVGKVSSQHVRVIVVLRYIVSMSYHGCGRIAGNSEVVNQQMKLLPRYSFFKALLWPGTCHQN